MGKFVEVNLTEVFEIPDSWEIVQDDEGNVAIQVNENEFIDFETTPLYANIGDLEKEEDAKWTACFDDESLDMLEEKGLKQVQSELDIFPIEKDDLDFDTQDIE